MPSRSCRVSSLKEIADYFLNCLRQERRGDWQFERGDLSRFTRDQQFFPVDSVPQRWQDLLASEAANQALQASQRREGTTLVFGALLRPIVNGENGERNWKPVAALVCPAERGRLTVDTSDLYLSRLMRDEATEEEIVPIRAQLK
ncbi:MAG: hypothetical protein NZ959_04735 [Armatimonadetes bacterium]|nr:hypothetical protein [Armatimonadota bacterium]MDW8120879.1 hypothetical protein [Armatimonadota bacterium]